MPAAAAASPAATAVEFCSRHGDKWQDNGSRTSASTAAAAAAVAVTTAHLELQLMLLLGGACF